MFPAPAPARSLQARFAAWWVAAALALLAATGCAHAPELAATVTGDLRDSSYPNLIPLDLALKPLPPAAQEAERLEASITARRDSLQARARKLQAPVVDDRTRERMQGGVTR